MTGPTNERSGHTRRGCIEAFLIRVGEPSSGSGTALSQAGYSCGIERSTCLCTAFPKMPAKVCCLTPIQLSAYVRRGELPNCFNCNPEFNPEGPGAGHAHRSYKDVERLVGPDDGSGTAVWIGGRFMAFIQGPKRWRPKNGVLQLVAGVVGGRNSGSIREHSLSRGHGFHYPILSAGGRDRNTSVYATNHAQ